MKQNLVFNPYFLSTQLYDYLKMPWESLDKYIIIKHGLKKGQPPEYLLLTHLNQEVVFTSTNK